MLNLSFIARNRSDSVRKQIFSLKSDILKPQRTTTITTTTTTLTNNKEEDRGGVSVAKETTGLEDVVTALGVEGGSGAATEAALEVG